MDMRRRERSAGEYQEGTRSSAHLSGVVEPEGVPAAGHTPALVAGGLVALDAPDVAAALQGANEDDDLDERERGRLGGKQKCRGGGFVGSMSEPRSTFGIRGPWTALYTGGRNNSSEPWKQSQEPGLHVAGLAIITL